MLYSHVVGVASATVATGGWPLCATATLGTLGHSAKTLWTSAKAGVCMVSVPTTPSPLAAHVSLDTPGLTAAS